MATYSPVVGNNDGDAVVIEMANVDTDGSTVSGRVHGLDRTALSEHAWRLCTAAGFVVVGVVLGVLLVFSILNFLELKGEEKVLIEEGSALQSMAASLQALKGSSSSSSSGNNNGGANENNQRSLSDISGNNVLQRVATLAYEYDPLAAFPYVSGVDIIYSQPSANGKRRVYAYVGRTGTSGGACNNGVASPPAGTIIHNYGIEIKDITDPTSPQSVGYLTAPANATFVSSFVIKNVNVPSFKGTAYVVAFELCFAVGTGAGIILYNVNDPANPTALSPLFGDTSPYSLTSGGCTAANVRHRPASVGGFVKANRLYVTAADICDQQVFFTPQEDIFDLTDPANPVLVLEWESRDNSTLKFALPVAPVPYNGAGRPFSSAGEVYYAPSDDATQRQHPLVIGPAGDVGWTIVNASDPFSLQVIAQTTWPQDGDWLNRAMPSAGNAGCLRRSPDGAFAMAVHFDGGQTPLLLRIDDPSSPSDGAVALMAEHGGNHPFLSQVGNLFCGRAVYVGYACANLAVFEAVPSVASLPPSSEPYIAFAQRGPINDPNYAASACTYGEKMDTIVPKGYTAVVFPNHHANSQASQGNSPDTVGNTGLGPGFYPNTLAFSSTHRAQMQVFNLTDDGVQLPYPLKASPAYREPYVGQIGARVCLVGSTFRGQHGYAHLFNATTLEELTQFMPLQARFQASLSDFASKQIVGCPSLHRTARLALLLNPYDGIYLVRYGGERRGLGGSTGLTNTYRIVPVGLIPAQDERSSLGGGMLFSSADFVYDDDGNTFVMASEREADYISIASRPISWHRLPSSRSTTTTTTTPTTVMIKKGDFIHSLVVGRNGRWCVDRKCAPCLLNHVRAKLAPLLVGTLKLVGVGIQLLATRAVHNNERLLRAFDHTASLRALGVKACGAVGASVARP